MLNTITDLLWGPGTLALLLGSGIYLTIRMRFLPWRRLPYALRSALGAEARQVGKNGISPFSTLMTTLAATIGTGNIVGVATALVTGGPGALIWMELSALFGMATIFSECFLSVKHRRKHPKGGWYGGPMYVMEAAFGRKPGRVFGSLFALFAVCASFGIGSMTQANAISEALYSSFSLSPKLTGPLTALVALPVILGGIRNISKITSVLVPAMTVFYLSAGLIVIIGNRDLLLPSLLLMVRCAFSPEAIAGGMAGSALRWGVARGIFSHEAGLGSSAIAAAAADTSNPIQQSYIHMTSAFFDTIVICTVTGLAICCSGAPGTTDASGAIISGGALTIMAFETVLGPWGARLIAVSIVLFAFSTILGWEYQGEQAFFYLTGNRGAALFRSLYVLAVLWGAKQQLDTVYLFSDLCNALMCIPNILCVLLMSRDAVYAMRKPV